MPDRLVTLLVWHDAEKERPVCEARGYRDPVLAQLSGTEAAPAWWDNREFSAWDDDDTYEPSRWARFPVPPSEDALTLDDLRLLHDYLGTDEGDFPENLRDAIILAQTRLRRAIEAAEATP